MKALEFRLQDGIAVGCTKAVTFSSLGSQERGVGVSLRGGEDVALKSIIFDGTEAMRRATRVH